MIIIYVSKKTIGSLPNIIISFLAIILNMIAYNLIAIKIPIVIFNQEKLISTTYCKKKPSVNKAILEGRLLNTINLHCNLIFLYIQPTKP